MDDAETVSIQIGRPVRGEIRVVARCHLGLPVAVQVPPILEDGTPFPTLFWLSCPLAVKRLARIESNGGIGQTEDRLAVDAEAASRMESAHDRYRRQREALLPPGADPAPTGGIGGMKGPGIKCLHAHYADTAAGNDNPVGEWMRELIEPLDCSVGCVREGEDGAEPNPEWREPS